MYDKKEIRTYVDSVIKLSNQLNDRPLDFKTILKKMFLKVIYFDINSLDEEDHNVRGMLDYQNKHIYIRNEEVLPRMRFTLAHELGHYILPDHIEHFSNCTKKCTDEIWTSRDNAFELEANTFAAELLFKGSYINEIYKKQEIIHFNLIKEISENLDVSFEATSRHLIENSPTPQILFIYCKENPEKHPSVVSSSSISNSQAMSIFKPYFAEEMQEVEDESYSIEKRVLKDHIIGVDINFTQNEFKRYYILTIKKVRKIIS